VIDDGITQDAIEPGYGRLFLAKLAGCLECAQVSDLEDVLSGGAIIHAALNEAQKLLAQAKELVEFGGSHLLVFCQLSTLTLDIARWTPNPDRFRTGGK